MHHCWQIKVHENSAAKVTHAPWPRIVAAANVDNDEPLMQAAICFERFIAVDGAGANEVGQLWGVDRKFARHGYALWPSRPTCVWINVRSIFAHPRAKTCNEPRRRLDFM